LNLSIRDERAFELLNVPVVYLLVVVFVVFVVFIVFVVFVVFVVLVVFVVFVVFVLVSVVFAFVFGFDLCANVVSAAGRVVGLFFSILGCVVSVCESFALG
jgi:hypothetical protein